MAADEETIDDNEKIDEDWEILNAAEDNKESVEMAGDEIVEGSEREVELIGEVAEGGVGEEERRSQIEDEVSKENNCKDKEFGYDAEVKIETPMIGEEVKLGDEGEVAVMKEEEEEEVDGDTEVEISENGVDDHQEKEEITSAGDCNVTETAQVNGEDTSMCKKKKEEESGPRLGHLLREHS